MRQKRRRRQKNNRILILLLIVTLIAAGITVYAAVNQQKGTNSIERVDLDQFNDSGDNDIQDISLTEESVESEENIPNTENTASEIESSASGTEQEQDPDTEEELTKQHIEEILSQMTIEQKVAQMFFITPELLTGADNVTATGDATKAALDRYPVGGLVYFAKNLQTPEQTRSMLQDAQEYAQQTQGLPLFLGVDEEGGRVLRVGSNNAFGVEKIEAMGVLATQQDSEVIYAAASTIGAYLHDLGFNVDFAPDADVITNEANQVISDRSFGSDPGVVADMAWAYREGLQEHGILACYKHFPGHGGTVEDSHTGYAYSYKTLEELKEAELIPFQSGCEKGIDFIMVSHVSTPGITGNDIPATLSKELVTELLREEMGYQGIIITDSMNMGAVSEHYSPQDAAVMAVQAGCDMLLMSDFFEPSYNAVLDAVADGRIQEEDIDASVSRIIEAKLGLME